VIPEFVLGIHSQHRHPATHRTHHFPTDREPAPTVTEYAASARLSDIVPFGGGGVSSAAAPRVMYRPFCDYPMRRTEQNMTIRESEHVTVTEAQICLLIAFACGTKVIETAVRGQKQVMLCWCMHYLRCCCIAGRVHAFFGAY
jgi:hypothetical protein